MTNKQCSSLNYSIHSKSIYVDEVVFLLSKDSIAAASQQAALSDKQTGKFTPSTLTERSVRAMIYRTIAPVVVTMKILPCPSGFELHSTDVNNIGYTRQCDFQLRNYVHSCIVVNHRGEHFRNGTTWIGCSDGNQSDTILAHHLCPFDYCKTESVGINLYSPDPQCALNHSGILCGGCPPNLSLAIGSSRCLPCPHDNKYVSFFLMFALAGILIILLIKMFDLTVSHGTINGLII